MKREIKQAEKPAATPTMVTMQQFLTPGSPYLDPGEVANMLGFLRDDLVKALTESPTLGGRVYARAGELATRWGVDPRTAKDWLNTAEKEGCIHPLQGKTSAGKDGDTLYKIAEVEAALQERRRVFLNKKQERSCK